MTYLLASAARATVGARSGQEDAYRVWPAEGTLRPVGETGLLAVLADGMGGHRGGAVAGQTACATFTESFAATDMPYSERLGMALHASNDALAEGVERNSALKGMGCTLIGAWFDDTGVRWTSVGDSLLLLYRFPDVIRLNEDHSLGSYLDEQARRNEISFDEARSNRHRNALRSALTGSKIDLVDLRGEPLQLMAGDWIILASDGIGTLDGDELADIMYRYRASSPEEMAAGLIAAVEDKHMPEQDNTTVVAVRVEGASESAMRRPIADAKDEEVTLRTRRIGVVSGRKVLGGSRAAAAAQPKSTLETLLTRGPVALLLAAGAAFVLAAAIFLFKASRTVQPIPETMPPPPPALKYEEPLKPDAAKPRPPVQPEPPAPERIHRGGPERPERSERPEPAPQQEPAPPPIQAQPKTGPGPMTGPEQSPTPSRTAPNDSPKKQGRPSVADPSPPDSTISEPAGPGGQPAEPAPPPGSGSSLMPTPQQGGSPPRVGPRKVDRLISAPPPTSKEEQAKPSNPKAARPRDRSGEKEEVPRRSQ